MDTSLNDYLIAIRSCQTWDAMQKYIKSLEPSIWTEICRTISTSPILTKRDIEEIYEWYDRNKLCPKILRPVVMASNKKITAWRFRLAAIVDTVEFGGTLDDAIQYFEFGVFNQCPTGSNWSLDTRKSIQFAWLEGVQTESVVLRKHWNGTDYNFSYEVIDDYLVKIPKEALFVYIDNAFVANFMILISSIHAHLISPLSVFANQRLTRYMAECLKRGLNFSPFHVGSNPVWSLRHIYGIKYHEEQMLKLDTIRFNCENESFKSFIRDWMANPLNQSYIKVRPYDKNDYHMYPPRVKEILLVVGCVVKRYFMHKDVRPILFKMILFNLYDELDQEYDDIRLLEKQYSTDDQYFRMCRWACLDRCMPTNLRDDLQCSLLAIAMVKEVNRDSRESYIETVIYDLMNHFRRRKAENIRRYRDLAGVCYDNNIAISLIIGGTIWLDGNSVIVDLERARELSRDLLSFSKYHARALINENRSVK